MIDIFKVLAIGKLAARIIVTLLLVLAMILIVLYSDDIYCLIVDPAICAGIIYLVWNT